MIIMTGKEKIRPIERAIETLSPQEAACRLCPRRCGVDRAVGETGVCRTGRSARVSHSLLHFGEEPVLSGREDAARTKSDGRSGGSGTIFFSGCNLKCLFCQNFQLSWDNEGSVLTDEELAGRMLALQDAGALNINFVSPTHVILPILRALRIAVPRGLEIPLVYNSNGYDDAGVIGLLDGIIDIYLPDFKYASSRASLTYSNAADYFEHAGPAVREMSLQQPVLSIDAAGVARKGLIVRHLVMPGLSGDSLEILNWMGANLSPCIGLSLMSQYHPCHEAPEEIRRPLDPAEYARVTEHAVELGFENIFIQPGPFPDGGRLVPDFRRQEPFRWD
ncbi:MAG: hypothetical protein ACYDH0_07140 [Candidatus Aminicenantales bacterium]